jgi:hypothetical protein
MRGRSINLLQFLQLNNVGGSRTFGTVYDLILDPCPLIEGFIALAINGGMMNENVTALIRLNKTKTFCRIKPLHFTFNHLKLLGIGLNLEPLKIWSFRHIQKRPANRRFGPLNKKTTLPRLRGLCG